MLTGVRKGEKHIKEKWKEDSRHGHQLGMYEGMLPFFS